MLLSCELQQKGRATPSEAPSTPVSGNPVPDSARDHAWASAMFAHSQPEVQRVESDDSAFAVKSHPDLIQAKREKRELKRQVGSAGILSTCSAVDCKPCTLP